MTKQFLILGLAVAGVGGWSTIARAVPHSFATGLNTVLLEDGKDKDHEDKEPNALLNGNGHG